MLTGKGYNRLLLLPAPESKADTEQELSLRQAIELERKVMTSWFGYSLLPSTLESLKREKTSLHTFGEALSAFGVFSQKTLEAMILLGRELHQRVRQLLQLLRW